jgi:hypothetical protein
LYVLKLELGVLGIEEGMIIRLNVQSKSVLSIGELYDKSFD